MIKAYIIDDDPPSIKIIEYFLKEYDMVEVTGTFTNPLKALARFEKERPKLVFLDINMAEMTGMEAAEKIMDMSPETDIIFTTAYDHFAVDAFELNVADYVVKPVMKPRFDKSMQRIVTKRGREIVKGGLFIRCFGKFGIYYEQHEPVKWRTEKSRELAALLASRNGREIGRDEIIELLWPDTEPDRAVHYLHNSIYYIRKSFEDYGIGSDLIKISGTYAFVISSAVDCDLNRYRMLTAQQNPDNVSLGLLLSLCKEGFMEGEGWDWAVPERADAEDHFLGAALKLSASYIREKEFSKAEDVLRQAYGKNPYDERFTSRLVRLYMHSNQNSKALLHYNTYSELIKSELGIGPGKFLRELVSTIY